MSAAQRDEGQRCLFRDQVRTLDSEQVVVIDECGNRLGASPRYARARRGQRACCREPFRSGANYTLLASLTTTGLHAPLLIHGAATTEVFTTYFEQCLGPLLRPGMIVILDNVPFHKTPASFALAEHFGVTLLFLPPYSPDLSPIELAFSKLKQTLRRFRAMTVTALHAALHAALQLITATDALSWFLACGYSN